MHFIYRASCFPEIRAGSKIFRGGRKGMGWGEWIYPWNIVLSNPHHIYRIHSINSSFIPSHVAFFGGGWGGGNIAYTLTCGVKTWFCFFRFSFLLYIYIYGYLKIGNWIMLKNPHCSMTMDCRGLLKIWSDSWMVTSLNERSTLEWDEKPRTNKNTIIKEISILPIVHVTCIYKCFWSLSSSDVTEE